MRVLIVDDDVFDRVLVERKIHDAAPDWTLDEAADVTAACQRIMSRHYDLVITDMLLPEAEGHAVVQALRAAGAEDIAVLSGSDSDLDDAQDWGVLAAFHKNHFDAQALVSKVSARR